MPAQPVQVSIERALLKRIDMDPETKKRGRSAFIRSAVELYLKAKERRDIDHAQVSCVNLTNVFTVRKSELRHDVGILTGEKMRAVCHALNIACGCD